MSFSKRQGNDVVCYTKPLDSLKSWNDRFFWVDAFACPVSFPWNSSKSVSNDPFPNRNYTLDEDTYPQFLRDNDEEMDLFSFIRTADPTKLRVGERQRAEDELKLLDTTVGRVVPLLPMEQVDSSSGGHGIGIPQVSETAEIVKPMVKASKKKDNEGFVSRRGDDGVGVVDGADDCGDPVGILILDMGYSLRGGDGGGGVWRRKWGLLVAKNGEGGGWEEEVRWCDSGGRD
ncbi:hypothetical protein Tco_1088770 [Tanacetum coccineum]